MVKISGADYLGARGIKPPQEIILWGLSSHRNFSYLSHKKSFFFLCRQTHTYMHTHTFIYLCILHIHVYIYIDIYVGNIYESLDSRHRNYLSLLCNHVFFRQARADASQQKTFAWPLYLKYIYVFVQCN